MRLINITTWENGYNDKIMSSDKRNPFQETFFFCIFFLLSVSFSDFKVFFFLLVVNL